MIDQATRRRIETAIADIERGTRAEFVAVIAHRSDEYAGTSYAAGAAAAALVGFAVWRLVPWAGGGEILTGQFAAFLIVFLLARFTPLGVRLTPKATRERKAKQVARAIFLDHGLALTDEQCGVMFFVAAAERYVEIIADRGIDRKVEAELWQKIIDDFTAAVRSGNVEAGFVAALTALGSIMARHYPAKAEENPNQVSNRLIEL